ncbi:pyridoxal-dependent decarboxylase conserved domain-containing protein [Mycena metata]|uniref:Pyridoxal-dependent decarboxylase conserved domain-containing protein n=1 Tax=Mycena metata TaxID=1033252 RepID=A0AAD7JRF2_9AGAR|nr:pyridoxal-dependent decarboxylase conserved domain-containing protein [Mycena metata]
MPLSLNESVAAINSKKSDSINALPPLEAITHAEASLPVSLPDKGMGLEDMKRHLLDDLLPAFNGPNQSPNFYGFVTGGSTEASLFADYIVSGFDQNAQVFAPKEAIGGNVEDAALRLLQQLLCIDEAVFPGRIFTTGATSSNILGLALGREFSVAAAGRRKLPPSSPSVAQIGIVSACMRAGVRKIQVLTTVPHSSLTKAASVIGLGTNTVISLPLSAEQPWRFDLNELERKLSDSDGAANIIAISAGEVNTGRFATSREEMFKIRALADKHGAWIHVDGAFGLQARVLLPNESYNPIIDGIDSITLADSITGDAHKLLNVPYDCGFFFTRHLELQQAVFQNGAVPIPDLGEIPSAHNLGIENSRRLRALPVYASLLAYGRIWHRDLLERQIELSRTIAAYIQQSEHYDLLPKATVLTDIYMIVLFRAYSPTLNSELVTKLNASRAIYVSGTRWEDAPATRIAVSTWRVDVERDSARVIAELENAVMGSK